MNDPEPPRHLPTALRRGAMGLCPACGNARMFRTYLVVADRCSACGLALSGHRADDAPPYFTIFIVGHIVVGGALTLEQLFQPDTWVHLALWLPLTLLLSLALLPPIKGALIALQWAHRMHGFGSGSDPSEPIPSPRGSER